MYFKEVASYVCSRRIKKRKSGTKRKYTVVQTVVKGRKNKVEGIMLGLKLAREHKSA